MVHLRARDRLAPLLHLHARRHTQNAAAHQVAVRVDAVVARLAGDDDGVQAHEGKEVTGEELKGARGEVVEAVFDFAFEGVGHPQAGEYEQGSGLRRKG